MKPIDAVLLDGFTKDGNGNYIDVIIVRFFENEKAVVVTLAGEIRYVNVGSLEVVGNVRR